MGGEMKSNYGGKNTFTSSIIVILHGMCGMRKHYRTARLKEENNREIVLFLTKNR